MKKMLIIASLFIVVLLGGCGTLREKLLAPPDEITIPEGSLVAICVKDDVTYKHIYKDDGIYQYFIDDKLQNESITDAILEQAYLNGESMDNYLTLEFGEGGCVIENYITPKTD